jgi:hypothetical protein
MTYNDPKRPRRVNTGGWGAGTIALVALVAILIIGGILYATSNRGTTTASDSGASRTSTTMGAGNTSTAPKNP